MERKSGYYWVKPRHWPFYDKWVVAKYSPRGKDYPDWELGAGRYDDENFKEINETRIPTPDEKSVIAPLYLKEAAREYSNKFDPRWRDEAERDFIASAQWMQDQSERDFIASAQWMQDQSGQQVAKKENDMIAMLADRLRKLSEGKPIRDLDEVLGAADRFIKP